MSIITEMAEYLRGAVGCAVFTEAMAQEPARCAAVFATDARYPGDAQGARVQILTRGGFQESLKDALTVAQALKDFSGCFVPDGAWVTRVEVESGPIGLQMDENGRLMYNVNVRVCY